MNMDHGYSAIVGFSTYSVYLEECERGIVHTEAWIAKMRVLELQLRQYNTDVAIVGRVQQAYSDVPKAPA